MVVTAVISAIVVSQWSNLFPPQDYEDCAARAAKDAKSKDGLSVLLSICSSEFKGRRIVGGGYAYYDACQNRTFEIKGPNPTPDEQKHISEQCSAHLDAVAKREESERKAREAAQEARAKQLQLEQEARVKQLQLEEQARAAEAIRLQNRKSLVMPNIHITAKSFKCWPFFSRCDNANDTVSMEVEIANQSKEAISNILFGLASAPAGGSCPQSYAEKKELDVSLSPGETRPFDVIVNVGFSQHPICFKVIDVNFAGDQGLK